MAQDYQPVQIKQFPKLLQRETAEDRYWKKFKSEIVVKEYGAVSHIAFSPVNNDYLVTSSTRVNLYSGENCQLKRSYTKFRSLAFGASYREDGKLFVAGSEAGPITAFDVNSKAALRTMSGHKKPVHVTKFSLDNVSVISCSDDSTVATWDLATGSNLSSLTGHDDYVRAGCTCKHNSDLFLSGSYDKTAKLWDFRSGEQVMSVDHGAPIEAVLMSPSGSVFLTAGGNYIKVWDCLATHRAIAHFSNHQKTITGLCYDAESRRVLSCSLDRQVKFYDVATWKVVHSEKFNSPLLSVAISRENKFFAAGMLNGYLNVNKRKVSQESDSQDDYITLPGYIVPRKVPKHKVPRPGSYRYIIRGQHHRPSHDDTVIQSGRKKRLRIYDKLLKSFRYQEALDSALEISGKPVIIASLFQELILRDGLSDALRDRDEATLTPILSFVVKNITNPRYTTILTKVSELLLDLYPPGSGNGLVVDDLFRRLQYKLRLEIGFQNDLHEIMGAMDSLLAASSHA